MPVIKKPSEHFDAKIRTGAGGGSVTVSGVGFQPDLVWTKSRSQAYDHMLADSVRGTTKALRTNLTASELTADSWGYLSAFNSDGYTAVPGSANFQSYGTSAVTYVDWMWKAGGTAVTNNNGSIQSQVSVNSTAGFSIVSYDSGAAGDKTVGHGLSSTPKLIITKARNGSSYNWAIYHSSVIDSVTKFLRFTTDAVVTSSAIWGAALPTSTVFGITSGNGVEENKNCIAYCWSEVEGYSKFGQYTGTGAGETTNTPFIYCGFRPAFIIVKTLASGYNWAMMDTDRPGYNSISYRIMADSLNEETTAGDPQLDFLSNGFKLRAGNANYAGTNLYMAFAEAPFKYASAR